LQQHHAPSTHNTYTLTPAPMRHSPILTPFTHNTFNFTLFTHTTCTLTPISTHVTSAPPQHNCTLPQPHFYTGNLTPTSIHAPSPPPQHR
jgi:hypothetical protein